MVTLVTQASLDVTSASNRGANAAGTHKTAREEVNFILPIGEQQFEPIGKGSGRGAEAVKRHRKKVGAEAAQASSHR